MVIAVFDNTTAAGATRLSSNDVLQYFDERKHLVRELSVGGKLWQDDDLGAFADIVRSCDNQLCLQRLSLPNNGLTSGSGESLARILDIVGTLRELDLSDNKVEAAGLNKLARALATDRCTLRTLNLFNNHLGCANQISHILRHNRSITSLNLGKNRLKSKKCIGLLSTAICTNESLQRLDLSQNKMGNARAAQLAVILNPSER